MMIRASHTRKLIYAIVLAAGASRRMGKPKQLLDFGSLPLLLRTLASVRGSKVDRIIIVTNPKIKLTIDRQLGRIKVMVNKDYDRGISSSIKMGLAACCRDASAVIFILGDQPFISSHIIDKVIRKWFRTHASIVVPVYRSRIGNPVLFDRNMFKEILGLSGDRGAKSVVRRHLNEMARVPLKSSQYFYDIDSRRQLRKATRMLIKSGQQPSSV